MWLLGRQLLASLLTASMAAGPAKLVPQANWVPSVDAVVSATRPRLLIWVVPLDAEARSSVGIVEHAAEQAAEAANRFQVLRSYDAFEPDKAQKRNQQKADAERLMNEARIALDDLDSEKATELYSQSLSAWKKSDLTQTFEGLIAAQRGLAASYALAAETQKAKAEIDRTLVLAPKTLFSDAHFPPDLLKYAEAQRRNLPKSKGKLLVRTGPSGARIWIDGSYRGIGPVTLENAAPVPHIVVAELSGYGLHVSELLPGEHSIKLTPVSSADRLADAVAKIASDSSLRESVAADLAPGRADQTWVVTLKSVTDAGRIEINAHRVESSGAHAWNPMIQDFPQPLSDTPLQKWMTEVLSRQPVVGGNSGAKGRTVSDAPFGLTNSQVGNLGLFAGAAVAAACFAVFGLNAQRSASAYMSIAQVESFKSSQMADQGKTFAIAADISWIASALFLGAGLAMWFLPKLLKKDVPAQTTPVTEPAQPLLPAEEAPDPEPAPVRPMNEKIEEPPKPVKKKTAAEERAEAKKRQAQERAERKRRQEEERAERRRQAEEEKAKTASESEKVEEAPEPSSGDSTVAAKRRTTEELKGKKGETETSEPRAYDDAKPRDSAKERDGAPAAYQDDSDSEIPSEGEDLKNY